MSMKCDDIVEALLAGGALNDEMKQHIQRCDACRRLRESVVCLDALGAEDRKCDISAGAVSSVFQTVRAIQSQRITAPHTRMIDWWLLRGLAAAALFVIVAGGGIMLTGRLFMQQPDEKAAVFQMEQGFSNVEIDELRDGIRSGLAGFRVRYTDAAENGGIGSDLERMRERMERVSAGIEYELYGMN